MPGPVPGVLGIAPGAGQVTRGQPEENRRSAQGGAFPLEGVKYLGLAAGLPAYPKQLNTRALNQLHLINST